MKIGLFHKQEDKVVLPRNLLARKLTTLLIFLSGCPIFLFACFYLLFSDSNRSRVLGLMTSPLPYAGQLYAALPNDPGTVITEIKAEDGRCLAIENYLKKYNSPLLPYANILCETSKKYGLDYRLLVAIAQQESNLCKTSHPEWFNCWGWGIHSKGTKTYSSFEEAIESVARGIKENYCDKGYCEDPCVMMRKYTPKSNGSWCFGVKKFMNEIASGF